MPRLVPVLTIDNASARQPACTCRVTMALKGVQANPALVIAITTPATSMGRLEAVATSPVPSVASASPMRTGSRGPTCASAT